MQRLIAAGMLSMGLIWQSHAGELVYRPINPSFGGDPFNGTPLLNAAIAQDDNEDPDAQAGSTFGSVESFADSIDRAILNRLALELVNQAFGEDEIGDGTFNTGLNTITVQTGAASTLVTIVDNATGEVTVVEIPLF